MAGRRMALDNLDDLLGPPPKSLCLDLAWQELLLLDYLLVFPTPAASLDIESHMRWHDVRMRIWAGVAALESLPVHHETDTYRLPLEDGEARALLALVPPTMKFGTGADVGFSCKLKLYRFLSGDYPEPETEESDGTANVQPSDGDPDNDS